MSLAVSLNDCQAKGGSVRGSQHENGGEDGNGQPKIQHNVLQRDGNGTLRHQFLRHRIVDRHGARQQDSPLVTSRIQAITVTDVGRFER